MAGAHCERFPDCMNVSDRPQPPKCENPSCPGTKTWADFFFHASPKPDACEHDFQGWREHKDDEGHVMGGERVCTKCGMGAMEHTLRLGI